MRILRSALLPLVAVLAACGSSQALQQNPSPVQNAALQPAERAVRRTIPLTNMIRRAHTAGTRDSTGRPGRNYWQTTVDYNINARLDAATGTISGSETIVLHNRSDQPWRDIYLRLDQNIYAANVQRLTTVPEITEGMKISRMSLNGQNVTLGGPMPMPGTTPTGPAAINTTQTNARIMLPQPIAPKTDATLEIEWSFRVPKVPGSRGVRMGALGDSVYQVAQWYPRVAVYDDLRGWDTDPYLGPSEFYNNFGKFDVRIDVPAGWLVGATGVLQNAEQVLPASARARLARVLESDSVIHVVTAEERSTVGGSSPGGRAVWRFVADSVNDFAWATSRTYILDALRATIPAKGPIPVYMYFPPSQEGQYKLAATASRHALEFYSRLWMPYAFPQLTLSWGPELGMEYPMFIMSGIGAADHEVGHEWWPMMVAVNETWYGWMDEGFNVYMNRLSSADVRNLPPVLDGLGQQYGQISGDEHEAPLMWNANYGGPMYRFQAYQKAPLMLSSLGGLVGDSAVWRAMSDYAKAWRFKHPSPWDFTFFMNNALGRNLDWFWYYWLFTTEAVHGSIQNVTASGAKTLVTVRQDGEMPSPVVLKVEFASGEPQIFSYPVDVWFGGSRTFIAELDLGGRVLTKITLDPNGRFPDRDPKDNVWPR